MSGRVVSDIQTRAEGESLYIRYNTDANVVNDFKNSLIIHEENTKKNHKRVVSVYVIQIHVDLHKL
jgi:hypothetical protein